MTEEWGVVQLWAPELRYLPVGTQTATDAADMIGAAAALLRVLL